MAPARSWQYRHCEKDGPAYLNRVYDPAVPRLRRPDNRNGRDFARYEEVRFALDFAGGGRWIRNFCSAMVNPVVAHFGRHTRSRRVDPAEDGRPECACDNLAGRQQQWKGLGLASVSASGFIGGSGNYSCRWHEDAKCIGPFRAEPEVRTSSLQRRVSKPSVRQRR